MNSGINRGPFNRSSAIPIEELPQFDVRRLLQSALEQIDAGDHSVLSGAVIQAARKEIVEVLAMLPIKAAQPPYEHERLADAEPVLRRTARSLMPVKDRHVESARLTLLSAADMLRPSMSTRTKQSDPHAEHQPEIPKVGSTDAPGG